MFLNFICILFHFETSFKLHYKRIILIFTAKLYKHDSCQNLQAIVNISKLQKPSKFRQQLMPKVSVNPTEITPYFTHNLALLQFFTKTAQLLTIIS